MHENLDREEEIKVSSERSFGMVFTLVFLAVGIWVLSGGRSEGWFFLAGSVILFVVALVRPSILDPLNRAWFKFGFLLGLVVKPLILGVVFFWLSPHGGFPETMGEGFASSLNLTLALRVTGSIVILQAQSPVP